MAKSDCDRLYSSFSIWAAQVHFPPSSKSVLDLSCGRIGRLRNNLNAYEDREALNKDFIGVHKLTIVRFLAAF